MYFSGLRRKLACTLAESALKQISNLAGYENIILTLSLAPGPTAITVPSNTFPWPFSGRSTPPLLFWEKNGFQSLAPSQHKKQRIHHFTAGVW